MANLKFLLGLVPKTEKLETTEAELIKEYNDLLEFSASDELAHYLELEKFVQSPEFSQRKKEIESEKYAGSEEEQKEKRYLALKKSKEVKDFLKGKLDEEEGTPPAVKEYEELEKYVGSEDFNERKAYLKLPGSKKFKQSDEFAKQQEYNELKKSDKIKWYFKVKDSNKFDEVKKWQLTFEDDFDAAKLDKSKWMTNFFWGEAILQENYSMLTDKHFISDKNVEIGNSVATIVTKNEKVKGKGWHPDYGFMPKEYNYTSGLLSTGNSFRQKYGKFEAKVRLNQPSGVTHAFWMLSEQIVPHVDVVKLDKKKLLAGNFWGNPADFDWKNKAEAQKVPQKLSKVAGGGTGKKFMIYTLEWYPGKLVWKINDIEVATQTQGVPDEPMYVIFSSGIYNGEPTMTPVNMEIDWVRCYEENTVE